MHSDTHGLDDVEPGIQRQRRVWWTIYVLDRQMSTLMGVPLAIADESVKTALPTFPGQPQKSTAWAIQIKLSRILAQIMDSENITAFSTKTSKC